MDSTKMKAVYTVVERKPGKSYWIRIGIGFENSDGSLNLRLDAVPVNGTLQVREWESRESRDESRDGRDNRPNASVPPPLPTQPHVPQLHTGANA